jgi:hypothetical protein
MLKVSVVIGLICHTDATCEPLHACARSSLTAADRAVSSSEKVCVVEAIWTGMARHCYTQRARMAINSRRPGTGRSDRALTGLAFLKTDIRTPNSENDYRRAIHPASNTTVVPLM